MASAARALRSLVAELAEMPAPARQAVLQQLDQDQAARVAALLEEYAAHRPAVVPSFDRDLASRDLSAWLIELLQSGFAPDATGKLTSHTADALRACAAELAGAADAAGDQAEGRSGGFWKEIAKRVSFASRGITTP